jgi:two-component system sensor histidine kinase HydH
LAESHAIAPVLQQHPAESQGPYQARPFELVRYFSVTSLVIILLFTLLISTLISQRSSEMIQEEREQYARLLAANLNHSVIVRFVNPILREKKAIHVGQPEQAMLLDAVVKNTIHSFDVKQVNILDLNGNIIYSTDPVYIGRVAYRWEPFLLAASGGQVSILDPPRGIFELGGGPERVLRTYMPMRDQTATSAMLQAPHAVFEIILDMSDDFDKVWQDQVLVVVTLLLMMILLFVILRSIVIRGQRIMDLRAARQAKLEEQLNQAQRLAALGNMIAGVAHEIRNPLGIVRSTAELLGSQAAPEHRPLAGVIVEESSRLNSIVTEFLDFARPQNPDLRAMQIEDVLERNLQYMEPVLKEAGVELERRFSRSVQEIMGDPEHLYRAFLNILNNSVQAMDGSATGRIKVSLRNRNEGGSRWVLVRFEDNGPGIDPKAQASLFDPFFTTRSEGTGLGLSIVSNIAASHNGRVEAGKSELGGARIDFWLPAV